MFYPDVALGSISGHDNLRRQNANGCLSGDTVFIGDVRCMNDPFLDGVRHS